MQNMSSKVAPQEGIKFPHSNDVLCGKGKRINESPGNQQYRRFVDSLKVQYVQAPKEEKYRFAHIVVNQVRSLNPPGRFLKQNTDTELWYEIDTAKAIKKSRQALREQNGKLRDELEKGKQEKGRIGRKDTDSDLVTIPATTSFMRTVHNPSSNTSGTEQQHQSVNLRDQFTQKGTQEVSYETIEIAPSLNSSMRSTIDAVDDADLIISQELSTLLQDEYALSCNPTLDHGLYPSSAIQSHSGKENAIYHRKGSITTPNFLAAGNMGGQNIVDAISSSSNYYYRRDSDKSILSMLTDTSYDSQGRKRSSLKKSSLLASFGKDDQFLASLECAFSLDVSMKSVFEGDENNKRTSDTSMSTFTPSVRKMLPSIGSDFSVNSSIFSG